MSHYICEIVIPPGDVRQSVTTIMDSYREEKDDGSQGDCDWWDFWVIGGRWSGHKLEATLDKAAVDSFYETLKERKLTVSGLQCGKQEIAPPSQIEMVDALWRERFPGKGDKCIFFQHARDQYDKEKIVHPDDVCTVGMIPAALTCSRLIVADFSKHDGKLHPRRMMVDEFWNGTDWQKSDFDGLVAAAVNRIRNEGHDYKKVAIQDDWLVVTVDYHN